MRFQEKLMRFLYGRNGADLLCRVCLWTGLTLSVVNMFLTSTVLSLVVFTLMAYGCFRVFSRNLMARRRENAAFTAFFNGIGKWCKLQKNKWRDRKTHVYRKCPKCKNTLRLPKIKGSHRVCCPCCGERFGVDVKRQG